jgi:GT2 family glycosyltransferase
MNIVEAKPRFTVSIPTFERPAYLVRAVRSVLIQTRVPDEVLVVHRRDDNETIMSFNELLLFRLRSPDFFRQSGKLFTIALAM